MKKFLILSALLFPLSTFATCPIEDGATSCSIAEFKEINPTYSPSSNLKEFSETPEARLNPTKSPVREFKKRDFGVSNTDFSYDSSCQFGVCTDFGKDVLFQRR